MIDLIKRFFGNTSPDGQTPGGQDKERDVTVAVCALFLEMDAPDEPVPRQNGTGEERSFVGRGLSLSPMRHSARRQLYFSALRRAQNSEVRIPNHR